MVGARWVTSIADRLALDAPLLSLRTRANQIWGIQIVFTGNADQREQCIAPGIRQRRALPMRPFGLGYRADRPIRGDPFSRGMGKHRRQIDDADRLIDRGSLHRGDLMLAQSLAHDLKPTRKRRISELTCAA